MKIHHKSLWLGMVAGFLLMSMGGCASNPSPRMPVILGPSGNGNMKNSNLIGQWSNHQTFGLITVSDESGPEAAPAISSGMLSRLSRRAHQNLGKYCAAQQIKIIPFTGLQGKKDLSTLIQIGKENNVEAVILALFSSTESTVPGTFGEARMMTQIQGTTTHNSALVELGLIDVDKGTLTIHSQGQATESLDRLNAPIGNNQLAMEEALDILRANAGQQALDKALTGFTRSCGVG